MLTSQQKYTVIIRQGNNSCILLYFCTVSIVPSIAAGSSGENHTLNWPWLLWHHLVACIINWSYISEEPFAPAYHSTTCSWKNKGVFFSAKACPIKPNQFWILVKWILVKSHPSRQTYIQIATHKSPPCIRTGGLKNLLIPRYFNLSGGEKCKKRYLSFCLSTMTLDLSLSLKQAKKRLCHEILIQLHRLYFSVVPIEAEIWTYP